MPREYNTDATLIHRVNRAMHGIILACVCVLFAGAQTPGADVTSLFEQAQSLALAGRLAEAERPLNEVLRLALNDVRALTLLAEIKGRTGDAADAAKLFRRVVGLQPGSDTAHLNLAIALADTNAQKEALSEVDIAIRLNPRNARAHLNRARLLADERRTSESRQEFQRSAVLAPKDPDILYYWGVFEKTDHRPQVAAPLFAKLVEQHPEDGRAYFLLGQSLELLNRRDEAIAAWRHAVAIDPSSPEMTYSLAQALRRKNPQEADEMLAKFRQLQLREQATDHARNLGNQAFVAMQREAWSEAIAVLQHALEVCGQCALGADLHQRLGLAECHAGQLDAGERELLTALALKPNDRQTTDALEWVASQRKAGATPR